MPLLLVLKRTREEFEPKGVEAFAYLDDISIRMVEVPSDTVEVVAFLQRELASIGIAMSPSKMVGLPPKGHVLTLEGIGVTYADPQAVGHMRAGNADRDGLVGSKFEARKRSHYARPGQVFLDQRSY